MELNDVIHFIQSASDEDKSIIKSALKSRTEYAAVNDLCADDIYALCAALPRTDTAYKGFRYDMTAMTYVRHVTELTNVITHNFQVHHNNRAYRSWMHNSHVPPTRENQYKQVFHAITSVILSMLDLSETQYHA